MKIIKDLHLKYHLKSLKEKINGGKSGKRMILIINI